MQLSDAIATGRVLLKPQGGYLRTRGGFGCALGMAGIAAGLEMVEHNGKCSDEYRENYSRLTETWPWLSERSIGVCPSCDDLMYLNSSAITHMFDRHVISDKTLTLDQLIDWVRANEPPEKPAPQTEQAVAAMQEAPLVR